MRTADFHYELPPELIAQHPGAERDRSRLLVFHRQTGQLEHRVFQDFIGFLGAGDIVVLNNSKVIPARLRGVNAASGGQFELLLLEQLELNEWWVMVRPGKRARIGTTIRLLDPAGQTSAISARVLATNNEGHRRIQFTGTDNILGDLDRIGEVPLPPYIVRPAPNRSADAGTDRERYQTVFAGPPGSVAAPTAGLHFTQQYLERFKELGIETAFITLHVGPGTFSPVKTDTLGAHQMHEERYELTQAAVQAIERARQQGARVVAVGTTTVRVLESIAAGNGGRLVAGSGRTNIFIYPPYQFRIVDVLLTNFHLPCSTLLMLVSAFAAPGETRGRALALSAYAAAIRERYRFFSYGDAMLIL